MSEFLSQAQLKALEEAIGRAWQNPGVHRVQAPDAEAYAYQLRDEIVWGVNGKEDERNLARGAVPLRKPS
jgi:hypothetical protein